MRIVTYNIFNGGGGRADPLTEILAAQKSDIVCLIEATDSAVVQHIARRLNMDCIRAGNEQHAVAFLSRWPVRETIDHASIRPTHFSRSVLEAVVIAPHAGELPIGVVHLPPGAKLADESVRERELEVILEIFQRHRRANQPHLLVGDFNSNAPYQQIDPARCKHATQVAWEENGGSIPRRVVEKLLEAGYVDAFRAADQSLAETGTTFTTQHCGQRVDYIFCFAIDPARIRSAWIEKDRLAKYASDHYPAGAEILQ